MGFLSGLGRKILQVLFFFLIYGLFRDSFSFGLPFPLDLVVSVAICFVFSVVLSRVVPFLFRRGGDSE